MEHDLGFDAGDDLDDRRVTDVSLVDLKAIAVLGRRRLEVGPRPGAEVIDDVHVVPGSEEPVYQG